MMENELFGSIDINDLANSEGAIVERSGKETSSNNSSSQNNNSGKGGKNDNKEKDKDLDLEEDPFAVDINEIANMGGDETIEGSDDESGKNIKTPAETNASSSSQDSTLPSLALVLQEAGVFSSLNEEELKEIKTAEDIVKAVEKQIKANELADLSDEDKEYLEARRKGVTHTEFVQSKSNTEQYKNLDDKAIEKNQGLQFELIRRSFVIKGISDDKAKKYAEKMVGEEDALEEALNAKAALIEHEESNLKNKVKEKEDSFNKKLEDEKKTFDTLKSKINENSEILPGIKVNSPTKERIFSSMITPVKSVDNKLMNEVMESYGNDMEYKMKVHALHIITKGFTDFSKFKTTAKSSAMLDLEKKLESGRTATPSNKNAAFSNNGSTSRSIVDALPDFNKKK